MGMRNILYASVDQEFLRLNSLFVFFVFVFGLTVRGKRVLERPRRLAAVITSLLLILRTATWILV